MANLTRSTSLSPALSTGACGCQWHTAISISNKKLWTPTARPTLPVARTLWANWIVCLARGRLTLSTETPSWSRAFPMSVSWSVRGQFRQCISHYFVCTKVDLMPLYKALRIPTFGSRVRAGQMLERFCTGETDRSSEANSSGRYLACLVCTSFAKVYVSDLPDLSHDQAWSQLFFRVLVYYVLRLTRALDLLVQWRSCVCLCVVKGWHVFWLEWQNWLYV